MYVPDEEKQPEYQPPPKVGSRGAVCWSAGAAGACCCWWCAAAAAVLVVLGALGLEWQVWLGGEARRPVRCRLSCQPPPRCHPAASHLATCHLCPIPQYADLPDNEDEDGPGGKAPPGKAPPAKAPPAKGPQAKPPRPPQGGDAQQPAAAQQGGEGSGAGDKRDAQAAALEAAQEKAKKAKEAKQAGWFELKINTNV